VGNDGSSYRNPYNLKMDKSVDGSNIKHSLVVNYFYELPFGKKGKFANHVNGATDAIIGGWQLTGIVSAKSGFPLHMWNNGIVDPFQGNAFADEVGSPKLSSGRSYQHWFNTAAFAPSKEWTYGTASRYQSDLLAPGYVNFDASIQKLWGLPSEKLKLQARATSSTHSTTSTCMRRIRTSKVRQKDRSQTPRITARFRAGLSSFGKSVN